MIFRSTDNGQQTLSTIFNFAVNCELWAKCLKKRRINTL